LISSGFVLCSQGPNSSSSSEGSEEPLVVPLVWFSLLFGLLAETGLPTVQCAIQFKMSNIYINWDVGNNDYTTILQYQCHKLMIENQ
jgi:hypothetical protein